MPGQQAPRVSVVVLNYNTRDVFLRCLEVLGADDLAENIELIAVDNASNDRSAEAVRERFPQVNLVVSETNRLYGGGMNLGASHASGEYVLLLNADTEVTADQVHALADYLDANPAAGAIGPAKINAAGKPERPEMTEYSLGHTILSVLGLDSLIWRHLKSVPTGPVMHLSGSAIMIRRSLGESLGYFDEGFPFYMEDTDLSRRIRDAGYEVHQVNEVEILHLHAVSSRKVDRVRRHVWGTRGYARYVNRYLPRGQAALMFTIRLVEALILGLLAAIFTVLTLGLVKPLRQYLRGRFAVAHVLLVDGLFASVAGSGRTDVAAGRVRNATDEGDPDHLTD